MNGKKRKYKIPFHQGYERKRAIRFTHSIHTLLSLESRLINFIRDMYAFGKYQRHRSQ